MADVERTDGASVIEANSTLLVDFTAENTTSFAPSPQTPEEKMAFFQQEYALFLESNKMAAITTDIEALNQRVASKSDEYDQRLIDLEIALDSNRDARRKAQARRNSVVDNYMNNIDSFKAKAYQTLRFFHLDPITDILIPIESSEAKYQSSNKTVTKTQEEITQTQQEKLDVLDAYHWHRTSLLQLKQEFTENWVVEDRNRTLMYALQNPSRAELIFARFAVQSQQDQNAVLKSLRAEFAQLGDKKVVPTNGEAEVSQKRRDNQQSTNSQKPTSQSNEVSTKEKGGGQEKLQVSRIRRILGKHFEFQLKLLTEEEIKSLISRQVKKIAHNNEELLEDVWRMIEYLEANPIGQGVEKLKHSSSVVTIGHNKYGLWHLIPGKSGGALVLKHKLSHDLRIVYAIANTEDGTKTLVLSGVYTHPEFISRFGSTDVNF